MLSLFSKRLIVAPVAGFLLSVGAHAMSQAGQDQSQQCGSRPGLTKPPTECPSATCIQTRNEVTLSLVGATTIHVHQLKTLQCQIMQGDCDGAQGEDTYPIDKVCSPDSSQQSSSQQQLGYHCGPVDAKPIASSWTKTSDGTKVGTVEYQHLTEYELSLRGGDSVHRVLPCGKTSADQVLAGLPSELQRNFSLGEAESAISGLIDQLESNGGKLRSKEVCDAGVKEVKKTDRKHTTTKK